MRGPQLLLVALVLMACPALSADVLETSVSSSEVENNQSLGDVLVEGIGKVSFRASRRGQRVIIFAIGPDSEQLIGRGEVIAGLRSTPIYLTGADEGLQRVDIHWGSR